jgi:carboxymethylenebutenolidase
MCTTEHSHPPIEPISGASVDAQALQLNSEDGATFRAFLARPQQATGAGIVILPDVRGLVPFFQELAMRFAERGIDALALDYFCRTAGSDARDPDWNYSPHVEQVQWAGIQADIRTAVKHLRGLDRPARSIFTTGFCMGGRLTSLSATLGLGLAGGIPFYGWPTGQGRGGMPAPAEVADKIECDLLVIYGGADHGITKDVRDTYDKALDKAGINHETIVYDGAPHGFFDRTAEEHADASADAWDRTLAFIRRHTQGQPITG